MRRHELFQILGGILTYVPVFNRRYRGGVGGTASARYCYSVWMRHLVWAWKNGLNARPCSVAELGPGGSIGMGLAALLSGAERYTALDVVAYSQIEKNLEVYGELVDLFRRAAPIPAADEFPEVKPMLDDYAFPGGLFPPDRLERLLHPDRLERIRTSILNPGGADSLVSYRVPWNDVEVIQPESLDMIFSQAVLEHVTELESAYRAMARWLKPGGFVSHQIDFKCHNTAAEWNGHWTYSDLEWRLIHGKRVYLLNRAPHSAHLRLLQGEGFEVVCDKVARRVSLIGPDQLSRRFRGMSADDLTASGAFIQARKQWKRMDRV